MADSSRSSFGASKIRRRNRMITSCLECRRRKLKCDKAHPCVNCKRANRDCVFLAPALDSASQLKLTEVKEKMGLLEVSLEQEIARHARASGSPDENGQRPTRLAIAPDEENLEPTPTALVDAMFDDDEPDNDFHDLGFKVGRCRLTDRIGGFFRPAIVDELGSLLRDFKRQEEDSSRLQMAYHRPSNFIGPDENFLPPSTDFFLSGGRIGMSLMHFLPAKPTADKLLQQYLLAVHPVCKLIHRPSFQLQYNAFWDEISVGIEPVPPLQATMFAMLFSAAVSANEASFLDDYGASKWDLVKNLQQATEMALARAKFLRTTRLSTLQAFVMYLCTLCRDQISRAHCALVAAAIRLAETMGLHRDGTRFGLKPVETHVRRLLWFNLLFLDHRCTEARGPRLIIREGDYDTKLPLNKNDENLTDTSVSELPNVVDKWTDMTITIMHFDCLEIHRQIWVDRLMIDKKKATLTEVMVKIENNRRRIYSTYIPLCAEGTSLQQLCKVQVELNISKWHVAVLHRFHNSISAPMPDRIRQIMLNTARSQLEAGVALASLPILSSWSWFIGAWHSWQVAFLLLADFYVFPDWEQPERTWKCLDFVFEPPQTELPYSTKARVILMEIWDRMRIYREDRRLRAPTDMLKNITLQDSHKGTASMIMATELRRQSAVGKTETIKMQDYWRERSARPSSVTPGFFSHASPANGSTDASSPEVVSPSDLPPISSDSWTGVQGAVDFSAVANMTSPGSSADFEMPDIDWNEWDKLFNGAPNKLDPSLAAFSNFGYVVDSANAAS